MGLFSDSIQCITLNACFSSQQAKIIAEEIPYVIGITGDLSHKVTVKFFVSFYQALASGKTIEDAYQFGRSSLDLEGLNGKEKFELIHIKEGSLANTFLEPKETFSSNPLPIEAVAAFDQNKTLADALSKSIEKELISYKNLYQQGKYQQAVENIEKLHKDANWSVLDVLLKKDIISTLVIYHLNQTQPIDKAEKLLAEAHQLDTSPTFADAVLAYHQDDKSRAVSICSDLNTVKEIHFKATIEIEDNQLDAAFNTLAAIDDNSANAQTALLKSYVFLLQKKLDEAYAAITKAIQLEPLWLSIQETHAIILFWRSCVPAALDNVLNPMSPMPFSAALLRQSDEAHENRDKAAKIFRELFKKISKDSKNEAHLCNWMVISLLLTGGNEEAHSIFKESLENKTISVWNILWLQAYDIDFDRKKTQVFCCSIPTDDPCYPDYRGIYYSLLLDEGKTQNVLSKLEEDYSKFKQYQREDSWHFWKAQALHESNKADKARDELNKIHTPMQKTLALRGMEVEDVLQTNDLNKIKTLISDDLSVLELIEICRSHARQGDWGFIEPHILRLITQIPTPEVVSLLANTYWELHNTDQCLKFLDEQLGVFKEQSLPPYLERLKVRCQQDLGYINTALTSAKALYQQDHSAIALFDMLHVQYQYGDIKGVLSSAKKILAFDDLINNQVLDVVRIVKYYDIKLAKLLWEKAIDLPSKGELLTIDAYQLGLELGLEQEAIKFQPKLNELLSQGKGVKFIETISELNSFMDERKEYCDSQYKLYTQGAIPVHLISEAALNSLATLFYGNIVNKNKFSPLESTAILARYGAQPLKHNRSELKGRLLIDVSSLMLADRLGLLDTIESEFSLIYLSNNINQLLFLEIDKLKASQPLFIGKINGLIKRIKEGLGQDKYHLLPAANNDEISIQTPIQAELFSLLTNIGKAEDLAWFDDRHISSYPQINNYPIASTIEILGLLRNRKAITKDQCFRYIISLREINYRFIPLDEEEILYWLGKTSIHKSQLVETKELCVLRQYWAACLEQGDCLRNENNERNNEINFIILSQRAIKNSIANIWAERNLNAKRKKIRSQWLLDYLHVGFASLRHLSAKLDDSIPENYLEGTDALLFLFIGLELLPISNKSSKVILQAYMQWLNDQLLSLQIQAEKNILPVIVEGIKQMIFDYINVPKAIDKLKQTGSELALPSSSKEVQAVKNNLILCMRIFIDTLPKPLNDAVLEDKGISSILGIGMQSVVTTGRYQFNEQDFFQALERLIHFEKTSLNDSNNIECHAIALENNKQGLPLIKLASKKFKDIEITLPPQISLLYRSKEKRLSCIKQYPDWWDGEENSVEQFEQYICAPEQPYIRIRRLEAAQKNSAAYHYREIQHEIEQKNGRKYEQLNIPNFPALLRYFRLTKNGFNLDDWDQKLQQIIETQGIKEAIERAICFPFTLPKCIFQKISILEETEAKNLLLDLQITATSPLSKLHLIDLALAVLPNWKEASSLANHQIEFLHSDKFKQVFALQKCLLDNTMAEISNQAEAQFSDWYTKMLLAWGHSSRILNIFNIEYIDTDSLLRFLKPRVAAPVLDVYQSGHPQPADLIDAKSLYPEHFSCYALGNILSKYSQELIESLKLPNLDDKFEKGMAEGNSELFSFWQFPDCFNDKLNCLWGGEKSQPLRFLVSPEQAEMLSLSNYNKQMELCFAKLSENSNDLQQWCLLTLMVSNGMLPDKFRQQFSDIVGSLDFIRFLELDSKTGIVSVDLIMRHISKDLAQTMLSDITKSYESGEFPSKSFKELYLKNQDINLWVVERLFLWSMEVSRMTGENKIDNSFSEMIKQLMKDSNKFATHIRQPLAIMTRRLASNKHEALHNLVLFSRAQA